MPHLARIPVLFVALGALGLGAGCPTRFNGDPNISVTECQARCRSIGAEMSNYVYIGQFSTACVCGRRGGYAAADGAGGEAVGGVSGSVGAAVAGVWIQMLEEESSRR